MAVQRTIACYHQSSGREKRGRRVTNNNRHFVHVFLVLTVSLLLNIDNECAYHSCTSCTTFTPAVLFAYAQEPAAYGSSSKSNVYIRRKSSTLTKDVEVNNPSHLEKRTPQTLGQILSNAAKKGLGGGIPGAIAGIVQVFTLMWLRTIINYQCRYGTSFRQALNMLLREGGIVRLYRGIGFALVQAPLARFVGTAANDGVESLLASFEYTKSWGPGRSTIVASCFVGAWRMLLMPVDTMKTVLQVDSIEGFENLMQRVKSGRVNILYEGAIANAVAAILGHYPWFYTYNYLTTSTWVNDAVNSLLLRNAIVGLVASVVSDTTVNAIRVVKTTKQSIASKHVISYADTIRMILGADGWRGFGRGLQTRIFANALQSILFTIIWRGLADLWSQKKETDDRASQQSDKKV